MAVQRAISENKPPKVFKLPRDLFVLVYPGDIFSV
jgi:hypothetical protein